MTYNDAIYYACNDPEQLSHETVEEAIEAALDSWVEPDCDMVALITKHAPITVTGYARAVISDEAVEGLAEDAAERVLEIVDENWGDPDGDGTKPTALADALAPVIHKWLTEHYQVWACNPCGTREYGAAEVEAMMREANPDWFEGER